MNHVVISRELQLEEAELIRLQSFLSEAQLTHRVRTAYSFGLLNLSTDTAYGNFRIQAGTNPGTLKLAQNSYAVNNEGNVITGLLFDNLPIPLAGKNYWVGVRHKYSPLEPGLCTIDANGNVIGTGTAFGATLRGLPNYPSVITFPNSKFNTGEYDVMEVINDGTAVIGGAYQAEVDIQYAVVGTFTPGLPIPAESKQIFQYDSAEIVLFVEPGNGNIPTKAAGKEFFLARVSMNAAGLVTLEDKRQEFYMTRAEFMAQDVLRVENPFIGVESIRFNQENTLRNDNLVKLAWGIRSNNYTINTSLNLLTLNGANGGLLKSTAGFVNGQLDNWRLILDQGYSARVVSSVVSGNQINLTLSTLLSQQFSLGTEIRLVPPVDAIEIKAYPRNGTASCPAVRGLYPIEDGVAVLTLPVFKDQAKYELFYRYRVGNTFSGLYTVNGSDTDAIGYLREASYAYGGELKPEVEQIRLSMERGVITLTAAPDNYKAFQAQVITGDSYGTTRRSIDNTRPVINLTVGVDTVTQIIEGQQIATTDQILNLRLPAGIKAGNRFKVYFKNDLTLAGHGFYVTQNYSGTGDPAQGGSSILMEIKAFELKQAKANNLALVFEYDGTNWNLFRTISASEVLTTDRQMSNVSNVGDRPLNGTPLDPINAIANLVTAQGATRNYVVNFSADLFRVYGFNAQLSVALFLDGVEVRRYSFHVYNQYDGAFQVLNFTHLLAGCLPNKKIEVVFINVNGAASNKVSVQTATLVIDGVPV